MGNPMPPQPDTVLKADEGWILTAERRPAGLSFSNSEVGPHLLVANVLDKGPVAGTYVLWHIHSNIFVYLQDLSDREPLRRIDVRPIPLPTTASPNPSPTGYATCLDHCPTSQDGTDLLIGYSSGEIKILSLAAQLSASPAQTKPISLLSFNSDASITSSRTIAVYWTPDGSAFYSIHADGSVFWHQKEYIGNSSDSKLLSTAEASRPPVSQIYHSSLDAGNKVIIAAAALSPTGAHLALACKDGTLRILDVSAFNSGSPRHASNIQNTTGNRTSLLVGGFQSYFGGLLCVGWSPDGRYIAAGGEDDLIAIYGLEEKEILMHLEGHSSWVSAVAWDSLCSDGRNRLVTVGQDCQIALWEVTLGENERLPSSPVSFRGTPRAGQPGSPFSLRSRNSGMLSNPTTPQHRSNSASTITPALPRAEMTFIAPLVIHKVHYEPLFDVKFVEKDLVVAGNDGCVKRWHRPRPQKAEGSGRIETRAVVAARKAAARGAEGMDIDG